MPAFAGMTVLLIALAFQPAHAADEKPAITFLSDEEVASHEATLTRVQDYISGLSTIVSDFTQVAPDGSLTTGKFYLQRPGKMRWQYNPPTPILMVANGKELVYYDYDLQQVSHIPLDSALVGFLAQEQIRFDNKIGIIAFEETAGVIRITLAERKKPTDGQLMLELSDKPLTIRNMVVTDATNQVTTVSLNNAKFGVELDKKIFVFIDPRKSTRNQPLERGKAPALP